VVSVLLGLLAGALTTLSPCVLPVLPFVLFGALDRHRFGPLALAAGMAATFAALGIAVSAAGSSVDVSGDAVRAGAAALMALAGVVLLSPALQQRFAVLVAPLAGRLNDATQSLGAGNGLGAQFALGALLGAVWSPCSGPTLGAAITLATGSRSIAKAGAIMLFFGLGASLPLLALAYGGRASLRRRQAALRQAAGIARPLVGGALLLTAALVLSGGDKLIEAALVRVMPDWLTGLTTRF
jgi:cytochrome c biogenesis protein CcdA